MIVIGPSLLSNAHSTCLARCCQGQFSFEIIIFLALAALNGLTNRRFFQDKSVSLDFWEKAPIISHMPTAHDLSRNKFMLQWQKDEKGHFIY